MSVVAAHIYGQSCRLREASLDDPKTLALNHGEFIWIGLFQPTEEELNVLKAEFDLHPLAVEDALKPQGVPKIDVYGEQIFVVARTAHLDKGEICYGETDFFVGPQHIITVRHGSARAHLNLRRKLESASIHLKHGVDYILHAILDFVVIGYQPVIEAIEEEVLQMERNALDTFLGRSEVTRIFHIRRELTRFRRILVPMLEVTRQLEHHELPCIDPEVRPYFSDVLDHIHRTAAMVDGLRDVLSSVFEVSSLLEQQRQGEITRRLAAWAAILAVPTAIAGIYGMNFDQMPELRWDYGYPVTLGIIVFFCTVLFFVFRRARWL